MAAWIEENSYLYPHGIAMGCHPHPRLGMSIPQVSNVHHPYEVKQGQGIRCPGELSRRLGLVE